MATPSDQAAAADAKSECVQVVVRCRPLSSKEQQNKNTRIVDVDRSLGQISVRNPDPAAAATEPPKSFTFDTVFDASATQEGIYEECARPLVDSVLSGYNGTVFAYGQTGTGKTFTMEGVDTDPRERGIIPRAFDHIFSKISQTQNEQYLLRACFIEIYQDDVIDLLNQDHLQNPHAQPEKLSLKEDPDKGVYVKDLTWHEVKSAQDTLTLLMQGKAHRRTGETLMNRESSRSHCIFTVAIECSCVREDGENHIRAGKLNMVDLAGSERQNKTGAAGVRLQEAAKINLSLSALGNVIAALTSSRKSGHIPYRDSKLTRLLQDSLGGNTRTVMIANVGPADYNYDETVSTLRFANRAKSIQNKPKINEDPKDALLRQYQDEIDRLRQQLSGAGPGPGSPGGPGTMQRRVIERVVEKRVETGVSLDQVKKVAEQHEQTKRSIEQQAQAETEQIYAAKRTVEQEKDALLQELRSHEDNIAEQRMSREQLKAKLQAVEEKLVMGNQLIDLAKRQELDLQRKKQELELKRLEAERVARSLKQREEVNISLVNTYESLDKEVEVKTEKLQQLRSKYQQVKKEIADIQSNNQREREELLETVRELRRQVQLKQTILNHFVPQDEHYKVEERAQWNVDKDEWVLLPINMKALNIKVKRPPSCKPGFLHPVTEYARANLASGESGPRFRRRNILTLELDMPDRTTTDYPGFDGDHAAAAHAHSQAGWS